MKVSTPQLYVGKKKECFMSETQMFPNGEEMTKLSLMKFYGPNTFSKKAISSKIADFYNLMVFRSC